MCSETTDFCATPGRCIPFRFLPWGPSKWYSRQFLYLSRPQEPGPLESIILNLFVGLTLKTFTDGRTACIVGHSLLPPSTSLSGVRLLFPVTLHAAFGPVLPLPPPFLRDCPLSESPVSSSTSHCGQVGKLHGCPDLCGSVILSIKLKRSWV